MQIKFQLLKNGKKMARKIISIFFLLFCFTTNAQQFLAKEGVITFFSEAPMEDIAAKNKTLNKAIGLIGELQDSLDMKKGGELSINLFNLYAYMISKVSQSNMKNTAEPLTEVISLISEIKSGWDGIPQEIRQQYNR